VGQKFSKLFDLPRYVRFVHVCRRHVTGYLLLNSNRPSCVEMLCFSIAHFFCFPTDEWEEGYRVKKSRAAFGDSIALADFFSDVKLVLSNGKGFKRKKKKPKHDPIPEGDETIETEPKEDSSNTIDSEAGDDAVVDDEQAGDDETGDDSDTEAVSSVATSEDAYNEDRAIAEALEESLGSAGDDPDIIEAKVRFSHLA
jgi:hypothetical protein